MPLNHRAILFASLAKLAAAEHDRDQLPASTAHSVSGYIQATVERKTVEESFAGVLAVGADSQSNASSACDQAELLATLLDAMPKTRAASLLASLPEDFARLGQLPAVSEESAAAARALLKRLRIARTITKRGSVTFSRS